jgi:hypothetical protein
VPSDEVNEKPFPPRLKAALLVPMVVFVSAVWLPRGFAFAVMWMAWLAEAVAVVIAIRLLRRGYGTISNSLYTVCAGVPAVVAFFILFYFCCGSIHF